MYCLQLGTPKPFIKFPTKISDQKSHKILSFSPAPTKRLHFFNCPRAFLQKPDSNRKVMANSDVEKEDFVTKVLRENPSQVEPKYLIGNRLHTLTEKENLDKNRFHNRVFEILRTLNLKGLVSRNRKESKNDILREYKGVYLKDILREYKGKLYVPEQIFGIKLSEEEEFNRNFNELPKMSYEDFEEYLKNDKIKFLSFKEERGHYGCHFVVELKEIPGEKSLHRTKWALTLNEDEAQSVLEQYRGPRSEIEKPTMSIVGKLPQYPHPVASKISSRLVVELMVLTTAMAAAAVIVGAFLAATIFVATVCVCAAVVFVAWPTAKPFLKLAFNIVLGIVESLWDNLGDNLGDIFGAGGFCSRLYLMYKYSGIASGLNTLQSLVTVVLIMVFLLRFTLSRKPKDIRKWDIWQGIEFSRSKAQARVEGTGVTFGDVAGIDEAVEELQELVRYLKNPELLDQLGIKPPHGVLLEGPPGCGKTLIAKAIAGEAGVPFYQMAGSEFSEILVGVGAARIRDLFKRAKVNKPAVIFIDEIDALGTSRRGLSQETDSREDAATQERETTLNQLLVELDGFDTGKGVIFIGATNRKDLLDPALLRPGRFDRKIRIRPPNARGRLEILKVHGRKVKLSDTVDLTSYAYDLPGWTGAELAALLQEAALVAVRRRHNAILREDLDDAVDRLTVGPKLVDVQLGHEGQCHRATTQVGAALTAHLLIRFENAIVERCDRISVIPRGQTLCQLQFHRLSDEVYMFERRPQLLHRLQVLLGGRAAEEVIFGKNTSKASVSYLADASVLARKIITIWNLENPMVLHGDPLPQRRRREKHLGPRIDFEGSLYDDYDFTELPVNGNLEDETAKRTEELMNNMYRKAVDLLRQHSAALVKTVRVLLDKKEIRGDVIDLIIDNYPSQTPPDVILEEKDPGSLPFFEQKQAQSRELEYNLISS